MSAAHRRLWLALLMVLLVGCSGRRPVPLSTPSRQPATSRAAGHVVKRGETLYAISMRHGVDYRHLAKWNHISSPYTIYAGQKLVLLAPTSQAKGAQAAPSSRKPAAKPPLNTKPARNTQPAAKKPVSNKAPHVAASSLNWLWPTQGRVVVKFDPVDTTKNGIDIEGNAGQDIRVAEAGQVVYSGSGLVGYGNLVIVKHNDVFLTAYGYNAEVFVKEGDNLKAGAVIAKMGRGLEQRPALHFQVRKEGKPVNPLLYLPKSN